MLANTLTELECIDPNLFGDKAKRLDCLDKIKPGDIGFLLNIDKIIAALGRRPIR